MAFVFYKIIDKSCFKRNAITVPKEFASCFTSTDLQLGQNEKIMINIYKNEYEVTIHYIDRSKSKGGPYFQLRWNKDFENRLNKEFIYSYINFMNNDVGSEKEIMLFKRINDKITLEPFNKKHTKYDDLFNKLIDVDFFGWGNISDNNHMIIESTKWLDKSELKNHNNATFVVYYLIDETKKQLYIGSAINLGKRFVKNREEIPGWNKFKYDRIHPSFSFLLRRIEHHTIGVFADFLQNKIKRKNNNLNEFSEYILVNKSQYD
jgi:hypothetical protein